MGLKEKRKLKDKQRFLDFLAEYGIQEKDLPLLANLLKKPLEKPMKKHELKKEIATPNDVIAMFSSEVEELNFGR
jgi:hypothetical protein